MPGWALDSAVDDLLKKEFDKHREAKTPHPIMKEYNLNFIPFSHPDIDKWRDSLHHGLKTRYGKSNIILTGGVDDIWINTNTDKLIIMNKNII